MTPNERLEAGADILSPSAADTAAVLRGVLLNHPNPPRLSDPTGDEHEDEWYNPYGTPDFAYGPALRVADAALAASKTAAELSRLLEGGARG